MDKKISEATIEELKTEVDRRVSTSQAQEVTEYGRTLGELITQRDSHPMWSQAEDVWHQWFSRAKALVERRNG